MKKFEFYDYKIEFTDEFEEYNDLRNIFEVRADGIKIGVSAAYAEARTIEEVLEKIPMLVSEAQGSAIDLCIEILYKQGIQISIRDFIEEYYEHFSYDQYVEPILEKYSDILADRAVLQRYRMLQQNNRSRWEGGGFGLSGAIKGAIIAGVLNTGTDFLRSFGDKSRAWQDNQIMKNRMKNLYEDKKVKSTLVNGAYRCIMLVFVALQSELQKYGLLLYDVDRHKAETIYENATKYASNVEELLNGVLDAIIEFPYAGKYYFTLKEIIEKIYKNKTIDEDTKQKLIEKDTNEIVRVLQFVGLNSFAEQIKQEEINQKAERHISGLRLFATAKHQEVSLLGYKETLYDYRELVLYLGRPISLNTPRFERIYDYIRTAELRYSDIILEDPRFFDIYDYEEDSDLTLGEYIKRIFLNFEGRSDSIFNTYAKGVALDFEVKVRNLEKVLGRKIEKECYLVHSGGTFENWKKGFVVTEDSIILLSQQKEILLKDIVLCCIEPYYDEKVRIINKEGEVIKVTTNNVLMAQYLESILKYYCINMYNSDLKIQEEHKKNMDNIETVNIEDALKQGTQYIENGNKERAQEFFDSILSRTPIAHLGLALTNTLYPANDEKVIEHIEDFVNACKQNSDEQNRIIDKYVKEYVTYSLLWVLVSKTKVELLKNMLKYNVDVNCERGDGGTLLDRTYYEALHRTEEAQFEEIIGLLEEKGAVRKTDIYSGKKYIGIKYYEKTEDFVRDCCLLYVKPYMWLKVGEDLVKTNPTLNKCVTNFSIPKNEKIYLVRDSTALHNYAKGIAFCTSGVYLVSENKDKVYFSWEEFGKVKVVQKEDELYFDGNKIYFSYPDEFMVLVRHLQRELTVPLLKKKCNNISKTETNITENQIIKNECKEDEVSLEEVKEQENPKSNETMFCTMCGAKISRSAKFCNYCGAAVTYKAR